MKIALLAIALALTADCALSQSATLLDDAIIPVPVLQTNGHLEAHYTWPHTNAYWIPEASTNNGASWVQSNQFVYGDGSPYKGQRMTQQNAGWPSWQVRLRKIAIIPQPNVSASSVSAVGLQPSLPDPNQSIK